MALGHRRLAIIDVAGGHQPLSNEDGTIWIVFNGEIYNFRRAAPPAGGRRPPLPHGQRHRNARPSVRRRRARLPGASQRDVRPGPLGRPAAAAAAGPRSAGRKTAGLSPRAGAAAVRQRVEEPAGSARRAAADRSAGARRLSHLSIRAASADDLSRHRQAAAGPPGHLPRRAGWKVRPYWQPDFQPCKTAAPGRGYVEELAGAAHRRPWQMRLQSDVPLGAFLSGGIDSSIIVGLMQQLAGAAGADLLHRLSRAGVRRNPLRPAGRPALAAPSTRSSRCEPDAVAMLPKLVWHYDEPFADSSAMPTWYLAELTRRHVTVALTGDGGDELFAGYPRYRAVWLAGQFDRLPRPLRAAAGGGVLAALAGRPAAEIAACGGSSGSRRAWASRPRGATWSGSRSSTSARRASLYQRRFPGRAARRRSGRIPRRGDGPRGRPRPGDGRQPGRPGHLSAVRPDDEGRHRLDGPWPGVPAAVSGSSRGGVGGAHAGRAANSAAAAANASSAQAFADLLPPAILRRPKMGFGVPLDHWFRDELQGLRPRRALRSGTLARGYFRPEAVRRCWKSTRPAASITATGSGRCWCWSYGSGSGAQGSGTLECGDLSPLWALRCGRKRRQVAALQRGCSWHPISRLTAYRPCRFSLLTAHRREAACGSLPASL